MGMSHRGLPRSQPWSLATARRHVVRAGTAVRGRLVAAGEAGMTTAEYAVGTLAACAFAALLIAVVRSPEIRDALVGLITRALGMGA